MSSELRVVILGSRGMLGTDLAAAFGGVAELTLLDREELDVTNGAAVTTKLTALKPDVIINATGYTDVDGAAGARELAFRLNAEAVGYLVTAAKAVGARLVHFSTEYVFDGTGPEGYNETAAVNPLNVYGESKAAGEQHVTHYEHGYLVRSSWLYGHSPQRGKPRGMNFVDTMLRLAGEKPEVRVVNDQFGKLTNTKDLAHAVVRLVGGDNAPGIYHLVNEGVASWYEVAKEIFSLKGVTTPLIPISSAEYPTKAQRPQRAVLLNTKFPPLRPWQEALREYLEVR